MRKARVFIIRGMTFFLALAMLTPAICTGEEFKVTTMDIQKHKKMLDDPRPWMANLSYKKVLPHELYEKLTYTVGAMKDLWAEIVGFKAPDVVGKIAPEIKPGTYSYKDKEKYPGFRELMIPDHYERFNPGRPPLAGNFPEIKIFPTRQYYWSLPIAEATRKNAGHAKFDDKGIVREETYVAGYPFPRPSGKLKANQIVSNWQRRYWGWESQYVSQVVKGFTSSLREDNIIIAEAPFARFKGRVIVAPYGWFDKRAEELSEDRTFVFKYLAPRDMFGNVICSTKYLDPDEFDRMLLYVSVLRRVRVMSATDIQDSVGGADVIYCDSEVFSQKLSATQFPYKCEVIAEREYLLPVSPLDGSGYMSSQGLELRNYEWERRPIYVIKMTQTDKNFVYGHRILYIDKETFMLRYIENYDQKGRLYRSSEDISMFIPEMGTFVFGDTLSRDHIDKHSTFVRSFITPAPWLSRKHLGLRGLFIKGK